jgi:hypothetical protein
VTDPGPAGRRRAPVAASAATPAAPADPSASRAATGRVVGQPAETDAAIEARRRRAVEVTAARRGPRRARLVVKHIDPWTVMKVSFIVSLVVLVVVVVAVAIIYAVLGKMGVWSQINDLVNEVSPTTSSPVLRNRGERRAADCPRDPGCRRLQPVLRPGRRYRGHAHRPLRIGGPRCSGVPSPRHVRGPVAQLVRAHP